MVFLSFIIAAHNAEKTLHLTLQSLQFSIDYFGNETEIIIINDSSFDSTQKIIDHWKNKFPIVITQTVKYRNIGQVRNKAVSLASGKYITMLDSDDQMKPEVLVDTIHFLKVHQPDMLLTHLIEIHSEIPFTDARTKFNPIKLKKEDAIRRFLLHKDYQAHLIGQFIHRKLYINNPIPSFSCYEDFAIFPNMLMQSKKIYYYRNGCYYYKKRRGSLSTTLTKGKILLLIECTLQMERTFPKKYRNLINCHWFDIYNNHRRYIKNKQWDILKNRISKLYSISFFMSWNVRFSYKKKAFKAKWKKLYDIFSE